MKLYDEQGNKYLAMKCKRPKFKECFGRTWDSERKFIDNKEYDFILDTTWGGAFYFVIEGQWYRFSLIQGDSVTYDIKEFFTKKGGE